MLGYSLYLEYKNRTDHHIETVGAVESQSSRIAYSDARHFFKQIAMINQNHRIRKTILISYYNGVKFTISYGVQVTCNKKKKYE